MAEGQDTKLYDDILKKVIKIISELNVMTHNTSIFQPKEYQTLVDNLEKLKEQLSSGISLENFDTVNESFEAYENYLQNIITESESPVKPSKPKKNVQLTSSKRVFHAHHMSQVDRQQSSASPKKTA